MANKVALVTGGQAGIGAACAKRLARDGVAIGVLDPCKVTRTALQNAASIAGLLLTTDVVVANKPKKEAPQPAMPEGGPEF